MTMHTHTHHELFDQFLLVHLMLQNLDESFDSGAWVLAGISRTNEGQTGQLFLWYYGWTWWQRRRKGKCCLLSLTIITIFHSDPWDWNCREKTPDGVEVVSWPAASNTSSSSSSLLQPSDWCFRVFLQDWSKSVVTICFLGESGSRGETRPFFTLR